MMKKIKITHIITRLDKGGSSKILLDILRALDKERFSLRIISGLTTTPEADLVKFSKDTGIEIIFVNSLHRNINIPLDLFALFKLYFLIRKENPDIVHTHTSKAGFLGRLAAKLAGVPVIIYMPHGNIFYGYGPLLLRKLFILLERFAARFSDCIITLTDIGKEEFLKRKIGRKDKVVIIHNGLDIKDYEIVNLDHIAGLKKELNIREGDSVISIISRLEPVKGVDIFIKSLSHVQRQSVNFKALIVGDGHLRGKLTRLVSDLGLGGKIEFLGYREDIKEIISLSDVIVNSALNEGLGLVILEAGLMGKPVVATKVGGVAEAIEDGRTGLLLEPNNAKLLATAIVNILKNKELASRLGQEAKKKVRDEFSRVQMIEGIKELYLSLENKFKGQR